MAGTNDFKAFATDANANVTSQEEWETLTALKKGFSSGKASSAQVSKALRQPSTMAAVLGQFIANAELDALDDGDVDGLVAKLATAITTNLGLGEGSALPVGVPVPWPSATPPTGWMKCNGSSFNLSSYPALAAVFPSGVLPDLRGEFIRGWDDGRLVDTGRAVMSSQSARVGYIKFDLGVYGIPSSTGTLILTNDISITGQDVNGSSLLLNNANERAIGDMYVVPTDTRPRNIAFNYIVRAA
ncbi:TPA: tail fiber protein [Escherichia coli]|nr:tail fiber protein [Escherichia coli]